MSYFEDQSEAWFEDFGIFWYAECNGVKVDRKKLEKSKKAFDDEIKKIYKSLKLPFGSIPSDFDPFEFWAENID